MRWSARAQWEGFLVPLAAAGAVLVVVWGLGAVVQLDHAVVPKPPFGELVLSGYPEVAPADAALVVDAALWWLCLSVVLWISGVCALGLCVVQLHGGTRHDKPLCRLALGLLAGAMVAAAALLAWLALGRDVPLMAVGPLVQVLEVVGVGLVRLASLNAALVMVVGTTLLFSACLLLLGGVCGDAPAKQMRAITLLMYGGAAFLLVSISTATAMYRLAASLLQPEVREAALKVAPTIALMGGLLLSVLLAVVYGAAGAWLQRRHLASAVHGKAEGQKRMGDDAASPRSLLAAHWPKVLAILLPSMPGLFGSMLQALAATP